MITCRRFLATFSAVTVLFLPLSATAEASSDPILTEQVMEIAYEAAKLSALAYKDAAEFASNATNETSENPDYEAIRFYNLEPDQLVIARTGGRCYAAFRGTTTTKEDWQQNFDPGNDVLLQIIHNGAFHKCIARSGYVADALLEETFARLDLIKCATDYCDDPSDCVVVTGHSQGAAQAAVFSIMIPFLMPTVMSFGGPRAIDAGCPLVPSDRLYRFVNTIRDDDEDRGIEYDPVPFLPSDSVHYGMYFMLGPDETAVKFLGNDTDYTFRPQLLNLEDETTLAIRAHTMWDEEDYSYQGRIAALLNSGEFPVPTSGFSNGTACNLNDNELCASNSCRNYECGL